MPRTARRQAPSVAPGQDYGDRQDQVRQQQDLPLPDMHSPTPGGAPSPGAASPPGAPGGGGMAAALAAAQAMPPPDRPPWADGPVDEPITAGLPSGPGPGPEALRARYGGGRRFPVAEMYQRLAALSGDPYWGELAQSAQTKER